MRAAPRLPLSPAYRSWHGARRQRRGRRWTTQWVALSLLCPTEALRRSRLALCARCFVSASLPQPRRGPPFIGRLDRVACYAPPTASVAAANCSRGMGWGLGMGSPPGGGAGGSDAPYNGPGRGRWARGAWKRGAGGFGGRDGGSAAAPRANPGAHCVWSAGGQAVAVDTSVIPFSSPPRPAVRPAPSVARRCGADATVADRRPKNCRKNVGVQQHAAIGRPATRHPPPRPPATHRSRHRRRAVAGAPPRAPAPPHHVRQRSMLAINERGAGADGEVSERATPPGSAETDSGREAR